MVADYKWFCIIHTHTTYKSIGCIMTKLNTAQNEMKLFGAPAVMNANTPNTKGTRHTGLAQPSSGIPV